MSKIKKLLFNLIFSFVSLYTVNLFTNAFNIMIPISITGVLIITLLGMPGFVMYCLIVIKYL